MKAVCEVADSGCVTLPEEFLSHLGLTDGDKVRFSYDGELTIMTPVRLEEFPLLSDSQS